MNRLLGDYIFDDRLRYEAHKIVYSPDGNEPLIFGGILAASVLATLLSVTDEGEARGIVLDTPEGRNDFFVRYEKEVLADNGGLFHIEVQSLNEAHMEFAASDNALVYICRNDRLYDLAVGLMVEYMQRLVRELVFEQIYIAVPWEEPFAHWLLDAGYAETRRQYLLSVEWTDAADVYLLSEELNNSQPQTTDNQQPTFLFDGLSAEQILNGYWNWLWECAQREASFYPDAKVRLAEFKQAILARETNYDDLKPAMKDIAPDQLNLFRKWMNLWTEFVQDQIRPVTPQKHKKEEQLFFPEPVLTCPTENTEEKYAATREYIKERVKFDKEFGNFVKNESHVKLCRQLTLLFGWYVDPDSLRKSMSRKPKRKTKKYT